MSDAALSKEKKVLGHTGGSDCPCPICARPSNERVASEFDSWQRAALQLFATVHANLATRQAQNIERLQQRLRMRMENCHCNGDQYGSPGQCDECKGDQKVLAKGNAA